MGKIRPPTGGTWAESAPPPGHSAILKQKSAVLRHEAREGKHKNRQTLLRSYFSNINGKNCLTSSESDRLESSARNAFNPTGGGKTVLVNPTQAKVTAKLTLSEEEYSQSVSQLERKKV